MNKLLLGLIFIFYNLLCNAQDITKIPELDRSGMDMSYYPNLYPLLKFQGKITTAPIARVIYGRPHKDGRVIYGDLIKYNELWRVGANEATEIEFFKDVKINNTKVLKGRYTLYCIPTTTNWTFIINRDTDTWGAFKYSQAKDVIRIKSPVSTLNYVVENLAIYFDKVNDHSCTMHLAWDNLMSDIVISF